MAERTGHTASPAVVRAAAVAEPDDEAAAGPVAESVAGIGLDVAAVAACAAGTRRRSALLGSARVL